jgi:4-hydroxybenzoate polyprenyltransferase
LKVAFLTYFLLNKVYVLTIIYFKQSKYQLFTNKGISGVRNFERRAKGYFPEGVIPYFQLLRIHHYIKNTLVLVPFFFSPGLFKPGRTFFISCFAFAMFSLLSSVVYILNDICDREKDRLHDSKCNRPIARGAVPVRGAVILLAALLLALASLMVWCGVMTGAPVLRASSLLALYLLLNAGYSFGLKNIPLVDITILASGYVIRLLFGAFLIGVDISAWLYLVITAGAYYLGLGKRRNEITNNGTAARSVMRFYSHAFLDKNMYMCQALVVVFYALWSRDVVTVERFGGRAFVYTVPLVLVILLKYSLNVEGDSDGDPTSVILRDKTLLLLCAAYAVWVFLIIYSNQAIP